MIPFSQFRKFHLALPNLISSLRGVFAITIPFLVLSHQPRYQIAACVIFSLCVLSDYFDGYFARRYAAESSSGKLMDPLSDKILILLSLWTFSKLGYFSIWAIVPILLREILLTFFRIGWLRDGRAVGAEPLGKWKFAAQVTTAFLAFVYLFFQDTAYGKSAYFLMSLFLGLSIFLTLYSGFDLCWRHKHLFQTPGFAKYVAAVGVGLIPIAPGSWGTVMGLVGTFLTHWNFWLFLGTFLTVFAVGYWAVSRLDLSQNKDPGFVVVDEFLGMMIVFFMVPLFWETAVLGYILFRFFDIFKPFPLKHLERLKGYWGIVFDDLGAGIYTGICLLLLLRL